MFCYKCGNQLPNGAIFCNKCGAKVFGSEIQKKTPDTANTSFETRKITASPVTNEKTPSEVTHSVMIAGKNYDIENTTQLQIKTAITDADMINISELVNLTSLDLEKLNICNITSLAQLTNLVKLDLSFNQISDLTPLLHLPNLTELWLISNNISNLTPLEGLHKLTFLSLSLNKISRIKLHRLKSQLPQCRIVF